MAFWATSSFEIRRLYFSPFIIHVRALKQYLTFFTSLPLAFFTSSRMELNTEKNSSTHHFSHSLSVLIIEQICDSVFSKPFLTSNILVLIVIISVTFKCATGGSNYFTPDTYVSQVTSRWFIIAISIFTIGYNFVKFFELTVIKVKIGKGIFYCQEKLKRDWLFAH